MADLAIPEAAEKIALEDGRPNASWYRVFARLVTSFNSTSRDLADEDTGLDTKAAKQQDWSESFIIEFPDDGDYVFPAIAGTFTITSVVTECDSGTCTLTIKIGTTPLGGSTNAVSTTRQTQAHSSANTHADGQDIVATVSANASCERLSVTLIGTRTFD